MSHRADKRPYLVVAFFFVLSCTISWSVLYLFEVPLTDDGWRTIATNPLLLVVKFGPSLAGLITVLVLGVPGGWDTFRRRLTDFRRPFWFVAVIVLAALATLPAAMMTAATQGIDMPLPTVAMLLAALSWVALRTLMGGGLGEEIGWRGVALPALLSRTGARKASLVIGVLWTIWHAPAFFSGGAPWWLLLIAQSVLTISLSFVFTWIFLKSGGSIPVAILFHGALNGLNAWTDGVWMPLLDDVTEWQILRILLILGLGLLALIFMPRAGPAALSAAGG